MIRPLHLIFALLAASGPLQAKDLWLAAHREVGSEFLRLSDLVENQDQRETYQKVFLGRIDAGGERKVDLSYISERLAREGFAGITPRIRGDANSLTVRRGENLAPAIAQAGPVETPGLDGASTKAPQGKVPTKDTQYVTLTQNISRGDILSKDMVELKSHNKIVSAGLCDLQAAIGKRAEKSLRAGTVLLDHQVVLPPDIEKGDDVKIQISTTGFVITAIGMAMENGSKGDVIKVRRKHEVLLCRVSGVNGQKEVTLEQSI